MGGLLLYLEREGDVPGPPVVLVMGGVGAGRGDVRLWSDGPLALGACQLGFEEDPIAAGPEGVAAVHGYFFGSSARSSASALLDGFRERGEPYLRDVDGEFAFLLWDRRTRTLYLCRDSFGTKPLFFACDGRRLAVASEIGQVLRSGVVAASPNRSTLASNLGMGPSVPEETHFAGVRRVLPSQLLRFSPGFEREGRVTWAPPTAVDGRLREEDVRDELPRLLARAIARRRWRRPLVTLSSGLDSASIAAVASSDPGLREVFSAGGGPRAITVSYPGWDCDESEEARRLARQFSIEHVVVDATGTGPVESAGVLGEACDQPYGATGYEVLLVLREARRLGHGSVTTGIGAEYSWETVPRLAADLLRDLRWRELLRDSRRRLGSDAGKLARSFLHDAIRPWVGEGLRRLRWRGRGHASAFSIAERGVWDSMMWRTKAVQMAAVQSGPDSEFLEQLGVREGVEVVNPYLDREIVEFAYRTPPQLLGTLTDTKRLQVQAMARRFPGASWNRPKTPSPDPFVARSLAGAPDRLGPSAEWRLPALLPLDSRRQDLLRRIGAGDPLEYPALAWDMVCQEFWLRRRFPAGCSGETVRGDVAVA